MGLEVLKRPDGTYPRTEIFRLFEEILMSDDYPQITECVSTTTINRMLAKLNNPNSKRPDVSPASYRTVAKYFEVILFDLQNRKAGVNNLLYYRDMMRERFVIMDVKADKVVQQIGKHPSFWKPIFEFENRVEGVLINSPVLAYLFAKYGEEFIEKLKERIYPNKIVFMIPENNDRAIYEYALGKSKYRMDGKRVDGRLIERALTKLDEEVSNVCKGNVVVKEIPLISYTFELTGIIPFYRSPGGFSFGTDLDLVGLVEGEERYMHFNVFVYDNDAVKVSNLKSMFMGGGV